MSLPLHEQVDLLLGQRLDAELRLLLLKYDPQMLSELIDDLDHGKRKVFVMLPPEVQAEVALRLTDADKMYILPRLPEHVVARFLHFCEEDDATDLLQFLPKERGQHVLEKMKPDRKRKIEKLLKFGAETAGGIMDLDFITVSTETIASDVLHAVQGYVREQRRIPTVIALDTKEHVHGVVHHRHLLFQPPTTKVGDVAARIPLVPHTTDREKILDMIGKQKSDVIGVLDEHHRILGVIHLRDLLKVAEEEATEDVYRFAGVEREERPMSPVCTKVRLRHPWLVVNLCNAFLASLVVSHFQESITQMALLAVFMPIVAGLGGNAATQALAVVVRGLAVGEIDWEKARPVILREAMGGMLNGVIIGVTAGAVAIAMGAPRMLGVVLGSAMMCNMLFAGFLGSLVPFILKRFNVDPATASSIFVTPMTDMFGFLVFLSLATAFLL
jgi:magnesium transporter